MSSSSSSRTPGDDEVLTLGSLSRVPESFDENEPTTMGLSIFPGAINVLQMVDRFATASTAIGTAIGTVVAGSNKIFQGLAPTQSDVAMLAQVAGRANTITNTFPPVWYVNFPTQMTDSQREALRKNTQAMMDFKCWSSLKWWAIVFHHIPSSNDAYNKMQQSGLFVQVASKDLAELPWLHTVSAPIRAGDAITCRVSDLHSRIMDLALSTFKSLDDISRRALEPVLQGVVRSASDATVESRDQRMVVAEKHEYRSATDTIRLINFEIGDSFYDVQESKNSRTRMVNCKVGFLQHDAEFDLEKWNTFSATIDAQQKKATQDFITRQTIKVPI